MTGLFLCPQKKEVSMKMIVVVLIVKVIINMIEKNNNITGNNNESRNKIIHPAAFQGR
jgi:hypothetical protein